VISCPSVTKREIRFHYDLTTPFYRLFWGRHIHHGLWDADESPAVAQQKLTETLAALAQVQPGQTVLDVGCGMGGSTMHLARLGCHATGVTISPVQRRWAAAESWCRGLSRNTTWLCADADVVEFPAASFDVVWSIECTEHLFDKPQFFRRLADWLKPGGRVTICAWLAGDRTDAAAVDRVLDVCEGFFCPSLGTSSDYQHWLTDAGLDMEDTFDWTDRVTQTWKICEDRVRRSGVRHLARLIDRDTTLFLDRFRTLREAYEDRSMAYGCFVARKPAC
jgi:tocopherol O-methyltransferase